jgi:hypothetical protein
MLTYACLLVTTEPTATHLSLTYIGLLTTTEQLVLFLTLLSLHLAIVYILFWQKGSYLQFCKGEGGYQVH